MSLRIRPAVSGDVDAIAALESTAFPLDPWSVNLVHEGVAGRVPTTRYVVAERDGAFAGYAAVSVVQDVAELQRISTRPATRRSGVATALVEDVLREAQDLGLERVLLEVREDNAAALALYRRAGFVEIARRAGYYRDGTDAIVLERRFVTMAP